MKLKSAFDSLLQRQPKAELRDRLHRAQRELGLRDNDALWGLLEIVQEYCDSLEQSSTRNTPRNQRPGPPETGSHRFADWTLASLGMGVQTLLLAIAYYAGASSTRSTAIIPSDWFAHVLAVPAGWMLFAFALPFLVRGAVAGWLTRQRDRAAGWTLFVSFSLTTAGFALTLWWSLSR